MVIKIADEDKPVKIGEINHDSTMGTIPL